MNELMNKQPISIDSPVFDELRELIDQAIMRAMNSAKINNSSTCTVTAKINIGLSSIARPDADGCVMPADMTTIEWQVSASTPVKCKAVGKYNPGGDGVAVSEYSPEREGYVIGPLSEQLRIDE